jgi:hypothetical protein
LAHLAALAPLGSQIERGLCELFCVTARLPIAALLNFLGELANLCCPVVLSLFEKAVPLYWAAFSIADCIRIRLAVSAGPASLLIAFDNGISEQFCGAPFLKEHTESFPSAAANWFAKHPDQAVRARVSEEISPALIAAAPAEFGIRATPNSLECECQDGDDVFRLRIFIPRCFPLEPPSFEISSIGREGFTRECRETIARESLRPGGLLAAITAWERISELFDKGRPCPICLSLLDKNGEMPKARCFTCGQPCHVGCVKDYLNKAEKKACPWCSGAFRKPKIRPPPKPWNIRADQTHVY